MKSAKDWTKDYYTADSFETLIESIQKDAFDAGWRAALVVGNRTPTQAEIDIGKSLEPIAEQFHQPKDTPCSKNTP